jgi:large subunit ribosomal protein L4
MPTVTVKDIAGNAVGELELSDKVFGATVSIPLLHRVVTAYMANQRLGNADTKTRAEVRGGGRKPWRQKGLGRARAGTTRAPQWRHGGVVFGPHPRDFSQRVPRRMRQAAIRQALSAKLRDQELMVVSGFNLEGPKTSGVLQMLGNLGTGLNVLLVSAKPEANAKLGMRNLKTAQMTTAQSLNAYTLLKYDHVVMDQEAVRMVEEVFGR